MITIGLMLIWSILFFTFGPKIKVLLSTFFEVEDHRHDDLQNKLYKNFIFKERNKIKRNAHLFLIGGIVGTLILQSWSLLVFALIGFIFFPYAWIKVIEFFRKKKFQRQLLLFIPSLSSMLRSGHGLERALSELARTSTKPMSEELGFVLKEVQLGNPLDRSLEQLAERFRSENMMMFVQAINISRRLGTSLTEAIDHIAINVLEKEKLRQQIHSLTSQGKMQAWVAVAMPFFMFIALKFISPNYFDPLFHTTLGQMCIGYCLVSMAFGLLWIYKITHKEYL